MDFMTFFPLVVLVLLAAAARQAPRSAQRRRQQRREAVRRSAWAKMEAFRAARIERTQMLDFSRLPKK